MDNVKIYFSNYFELIVKITSQCKTETPSVSDQNMAAHYSKCRHLTLITLSQTLKM